MNILFYRYGSICEDDILKCFAESGHKCITIEDEIRDKSITGADSLRLVDERLQQQSFDCVFTVNFYPSISDLCNIYHIRYICWVVDSPVLELFASSISNEWNRVFVFDRCQYEDIRLYNPGRIFHYPLAVDTSAKQAVIREAVLDKRVEKFAADISFVGSLYSEKDPMNSLTDAPQYLQGYIEGICEAQLKVYGYYFVEEMLSRGIIDDFKSHVKDYYTMKCENHLTDKVIIGQYYIGNHITSLERQRLIAHVSKDHATDVYTRSNTDPIKGANCKGGCQTLTEMPLVFYKSRINLNPTSKAIRSGVPLRVFDILACEGFMLSNYQTELCELFVPGEDFVYYESIEQVPEIAAYYLEHENERIEIAHNGYTKVKEQYSYMVRLNGLLLKAFEN
ncbi:MAG: glycosyltransferase [Lachnospiraceae bacterium]|nr:glycosyltransferase [Lachnospiraceae bacterium]